MISRVCTAWKEYESDLQADLSQDPFNTGPSGFI